MLPLLVVQYRAEGATLDSCCKISITLRTLNERYALLTPLKYRVGVEKVTSISRMRFSRSMLEGSIRHALLDSHRRRPADHDGATRPLRSSVLLLPFGRSSS